MTRRSSATPEGPDIIAKREYHMSIARAWHVYDEDVEQFRIARDLELLASGDPNDPKVWKKYDDATFEFRLKFEKDVAVKWRMCNMIIARNKALRGEKA
jgi:hypothetical protein